MQKCSSCLIDMTLTKEYGDLLVFETEPLLSKYFFKEQIANVQNEISIADQMYQLYAVIEFDIVSEHFIAHVKRRNGIWQTFDDMKGHVLCNKKTENTSMNIFILFYLKK